MSGYTEVGTQEAPASQMDETVEALYLQISNLDDESELADFEDGMQNIEELFQIVSSETHVDLEKRQRFQHEIEFLQTIVGDPRQVDVWIEMIKELNEELSNYLMGLLHSNNGQSNPRTESTAEHHVSVRFPMGHERESIPDDAENEEKVMRRGMAQIALILPPCCA